jgi:hypothetical protein
VGRQGRGRTAKRITAPKMNVLVEFDMFYGLFIARTAKWEIMHKTYNTIHAHFGNIHVVVIYSFD